MAKEKWEAMEIARVKLNPEQAVLTCCDASTKVQQEPEFYISQCTPDSYACPGGEGSDAVSS